MSGHIQKSKDNNTTFKYILEISYSKGQFPFFPLNLLFSKRIANRAKSVFFFFFFYLYCLSSGPNNYCRQLKKKKNKTKQNKTKQNKTKQNKTKTKQKQNKRNKTHPIHTHKQKQKQKQTKQNKLGTSYNGIRQGDKVIIRFTFHIRYVYMLFLKAFPDYWTIC